MTHVQCEGTIMITCCDLLANACSLVLTRVDMELLLKVALKWVGRGRGIMRGARGPWRGEITP